MPEYISISSATSILDFGFWILDLDLDFGFELFKFQILDLRLLFFWLLAIGFWL